LANPNLRSDISRVEHVLDEGEGEERGRRQPCRHPPTSELRQVASASAVALHYGTAASPLDGGALTRKGNAPARGSATVPPASTRDGLLRRPPSSSASPHSAVLGESERQREEKVRARVSALALRAVLFGRTWRAVVGSHPMARSCSRAQGRDREAVDRLLGSVHLAMRVRFSLPARFPLTERQEKKGPSRLYDFFFPVTVLCFIFWK
jgi:hypothetical protein